MSAASPVPLASGLTPSAWTPFTLQGREKHTHNTDVYTFTLKDPKATPGLTVSSCIMTRFEKKDETGKAVDVTRPYTPIDTHEAGVMKLLIKVYPQGNMSRHIHELKVGDSLDMKGPFAKLKYEANKWKHIGMIAGGTGLTPMVQVADEIFRNPDDKTRVTLLSFQTSSGDVLLRDKLDAYAAQRPDQFTVVHVCDRKEDGVDWVKEHGHVSEALLRKYMPAASTGKDALVYVCGPPKFMEAVSGNKTPKYEQGDVTGLLKTLGFENEQVYKL